MGYKKDQGYVKEFKHDLGTGEDLSLFGAIRSGTKLALTLCLEEGTEALGAEFRIHSDGYEGKICSRIYQMESTGKSDVYRLVLDVGDLAESLIGERVGLFYYEYAVDTPCGLCCFGGENVTKLEPSGDAGERQLLIYSDTPEPELPPGIIYHIFVDRFRRSGKCEVRAGAVIDPDWDHGTPQFASCPGDPLPNNVFFGGDLYGVIEMLPYIASLGTSVIYLSPIFEAASNHKYDTGDYLSVDSMFGGDAALEELCKAAAEYGMEIMLDGVFNHTGSDSIYFNREEHYSSIGAYQSDDSEFYGWYSFRHFPDDYECWWGIDILPRVKSSEASYRDFICGNVLDKWSRAGVRHWRLDVADELDDLFLNDFSAALRRRDPGALIVGEVWEDASDKVSYGRRRHYFTHAQLGSVMNYPLRAAVLSYVLDGDTESLRRATEGLYRRYPKHVSDHIMNILGTHDTERVLTALGDRDWFGESNKELSQRRMTSETKAHAVSLLVEAYSIICALPGIPCVYYGDEAGMEGFRDPFCRRPFPWNDRDTELTEKYAQLGMTRRDEKWLDKALFSIEALTPQYLAVRRTSADGVHDVLYVINNTDCELRYDTESCCISSGDFGITVPPRERVTYHISDKNSAV